MNDEAHAPGRCTGRGAGSESTVGSPHRATPRRVRQGLAKVAGGVVVGAAGRFLAFRMTAEGLVQAGAVAHSFGAAVATLGGR